MKTAQLFLLMLLFVSARSQSVQDTISEPWKLDSTGKKAWESFEKDFNTWFYKVYCPAMKVKITCARCSRFNHTVTFKVDSTGTPIILTADSGNYCGYTLSEKRKKFFVTGIKKRKFENYFKGKIIKFNFNRTLKC